MEVTLHARRSSLASSLVALLVLLAGERAASAQCSQAGQVRALKRSLAQVLTCNQTRLTTGPVVPCMRTPAPACASTLVDDVAALVYGANDPPSDAVDTAALAGQLACQTALGDAARKYVDLAMDALVNGQTPAQADAAGAPELAKISGACAVQVAKDASGVLLPAVGPQCGAAVGAPGSPVDAPALQSCVQALLKLWTNRYAPQPQPLRPNILLIQLDDLRVDMVGPRYSLDGVTPIMANTLAQLRDQGVEATNAFVTSPQCAPSRASLLTGQYAHDHGLRANPSTAKPYMSFSDTSTLATSLQAAGYRTSLIGKYLNGYNQLWAGGQTPYTPPGWSDWHAFKSPDYYNYYLIENGVQSYFASVPSDYSTDVLRERAKTFIQQASALGQPWFLYLSLYAPHSPQLAAPRHDGLLQSLSPALPVSFDEANLSDKPLWMQSLPHLLPHSFDQDQLDSLETLFAADEAIGGSNAFGITGVLDVLRQLGIEDDTFIVFTADEGALWGEHRLTGGAHPYEESVRVPLFLRYPRLAPLGRQDSHVMLDIDLVPTWLELAGATPIVTPEGQSLVRVLDGTQRAWRADFMMEGQAGPTNAQWAAIREGTWEYVEYIDGEMELYDLVADPYEMDSVHNDPGNAARVAAMAARIRDFRPNWPADEY